MLPLDLHAHIEPRIPAEQLNRLRACVVAVTRSQEEFELVMPRNDPAVAWAIGCHPGLARAVQNFAIERFEDGLRKVAVVGEIGLDGTSRVPLERQQHVLSSVLGVLATRPRIASIHSYRATSAVLELLDQHRPSGAVLHWWLGNEAETRRAIELGAFFSVNSNQANRWPGLRLVPKDRLLTETDHPFGDRREQGERRPGNVAAVERRLGELLNADPHDVRRLTWQNFRRLTDALPIHDLLPREFQVQLLAV